MFVITPQGKRLFIHDAWGLTRVALPNKVKTDRKRPSPAWAPLSVSVDGEHILAHETGHYDLLSADTLARDPSLRVFTDDSTGLNPYSNRALTLAREGEGLALVFHDEPERREPIDLHGARTDVLYLGSGPAEPFDRDVFAQLRYAFMVLHAPSGCVVRAGLGHGERVEVQAQVPVVRPRDVAVTLLPPEFIVGASPLTGEVGVARITDRVRAAWTFQGLGPVARDAGFKSGLVAQLDDTSVAAFDDDGARTAAYAIDPDDGRYPGELCVANGAAFFLPWHGEHVVELKTARTIPRKLPPAEAPLRRHLAERVALANRCGAELGLRFVLKSVSVISRSTRVSVDIDSRGRESDLAASLAKAWATHLVYPNGNALPAPFTTASAGLLGPRMDYASITAADVTVACGVADRHGLWAPCLLPALGERYRRRAGLSTAFYGEDLAAPPAEDGVGRALLRWMLAQLATREPVRASPRAGEWLESPLTAAEVVAGLDATDDEALSRVSWVSARLAVMIERELGAEAMAPLVALACSSRERLAIDGWSEVVDAVERVARAHPASRATGRASLARLREQAATRGELARVEAALRHA